MDNRHRQWYECTFCGADLRSYRHDPFCPANNPVEDFRVQSVIRAHYCRLGLVLIKGGKDGNG